MRCASGTWGTRGTCGTRAPSSELRARQGLGVVDALDGADLVDDDVAERVEVGGLELGDEVVLAEEGVQLDDLGHLEQGVVHLVLLARRGADEDEANGHCRGWTRTG